MASIHPADPHGAHTPERGVRPAVHEVVPAAETLEADANMHRPKRSSARRAGSHFASPIGAVRQRATLVSHVLVASTLLLVMYYGLLVGLLSLCIGFLATRALSRPIGRLLGRKDRYALAIAGTLVAIAPLVLLALAVPRTRNLILDAPTQYRELLAFLAQTVLELRDKLPPDIAVQLPVGAADVQHTLATYLASKAGNLANAGRVWLGGLLLAFIGLLVGVLAAVHKPVRRPRPLAAALRERIGHFGRVFTQIIVAQFWIALFNTSLTAIFLLVLVPLWGTHLPYTKSLLVLTFVAGLIPIVGNLICNTVLTLVGLSVSLPVAIACLAFLIAIHKTEYFINAKVVGQRVHMGAWELLTVMFVMEAIFGAAGLVAAPLFYAYAKQELEASGWV